MEHCIYEDIDKLDSLSLSSSEQNSNQSYDISQVNIEQKGLIPTQANLAKVVSQKFISFLI
jgi:hypothetical protein